MRSSPVAALLALALVGGLSHVAVASAPYLTCDEITKREGAGTVADSGQGNGNWESMAKIICSSVERMRAISADKQTKAEQEEIHRLYLAAVDGEALKIRAVPSCIKQTEGDGDLEARVVKIVRGFISQNGATLQRSAKPVQIMATARWPEKLEGRVDTGEGDPVPISWLFRCKSNHECKIIDIQVGGSMSMTDAIRGDLSTSAQCKG